MTGPLTGLRVVEMDGIGPTPHAAMLLADLGADVIRVQRRNPRGAPDGVADADHVLWRNRRVVRADLKTAADRDCVVRLIAAADVLIEGFRPGVMERLGLGPGDCLGANPGLVYARMTGWGQDGPWATRAGHDINYLALTGLLHAMGPAQAPPLPPLNLAADFGGGSVLLAFGIMAALWERHHTGQGQVVDGAMVDGANLLGQLLWSWRDAGRWSDRRGTNMLDGSAPFYRTYECADGKYVAVGALEPPFYRQLLDGLGLDSTALPDRWDKAAWPQLADCLAERFAEQTRDSWVHVFGDRDACVTPVLEFGEVPAHEHISQRNTVIEVAGVPQAAPAPRFSRTAAPLPAPARETELADALEDWQ
jgi:alpha-methylacyl-CoA racemase